MLANNRIPEIGQKNLGRRVYNLTLGGNCRHLLSVHSADPVSSNEYMAYPDANPKIFRTFSRTFSKSRQNPIFPLFHCLTYSLSDTGLVHGRRLKRLQKRHSPLIQGQHMRKTEIVPPPPTGRQSLIPEQPAPQLKGSSQVLFTYNIYVNVSCYPAPRCGRKAEKGNLCLYVYITSNLNGPFVSCSSYDL